MKEEVRDYVDAYLAQVVEISGLLSRPAIIKIVEGLVALRDTGGRLFILGVGGSAGNASHAVNDFRKIANVESYAPTDNTSELTARVNDDGWETCFARWLCGSRLRAGDTLFVLSVGGGNQETNISMNIVRAHDLAL